MQELTGAIRSLAIGKAIGSDGVSVELFKIPLNGDPALHRRLLDIVVCIWRGARCRSSGNMLSSWYSIKFRIGQSHSSIYIILCQGKLIVNDSTWELVRATLFFRVILYCMMLPLVFRLWVVLQSPFVSPTCYADNDMFFIIYLQDS